MFPNSINRRITQTQQRLQNEEFMSNIKISTKNLDLYYGENHALKNINMNIKAGAITAFIGPSGCGKSTFLKTLNRMNDLVDNVKITGEVKIDGEDIYDPHVDVTLLRKKAGMVFQQPNPFPMSIYDNIAYGPRIHGIKNKAQLDEIVETSLKNAAIFDEVKDRLKKSALGLSGGQQQRTLLARALCAASKVILLDEPVTGLDPKVTAEFYQVTKDLSEEGIAVIMVSHDVQALDYATHILHMQKKNSFYGTKEEYMNSDKWKLFKNTEENRIGGDKK